MTMPEPLRAIDANVLLRYLLSDVPEQAHRARRLVDSEQPLGLTAVALAEVAWTLAGPRYRRARATVATQLIDLLARENIVTVGFDKAEAQAALMACAVQVGAANFGDALIAACARSAGVQEIYSFDQRFARTGLTPLAPL
jgi:predicted nucleic acid-binding protein